MILCCIAEKTILVTRIESECDYLFGDTDIKNLRKIKLLDCIN